MECIILAVWPTPGMQASISTNHGALARDILAPASFYDGFSPTYAELMRELMMQAIAALRRPSPEDRRREDFGVLLRVFTDVQVADSASLLLQKPTRHRTPSTSMVKPVRVTCHAIVSLTDGVPFADRRTEQRLQDSAGLPDAALVTVTLTLFDLGYLDVKRFIDAVERGAHFLTRLKTNHHPVVLHLYSGNGDRVKVRSKRLDEAVAQEVLLELSSEEREGRHAIAQLPSSSRSPAARHCCSRTPTCVAASALGSSKGACFAPPPSWPARATRAANAPGASENTSLVMLRKPIAHGPGVDP